MSTEKIKTMAIMTIIVLLTTVFVFYLFLSKTDKRQGPAPQTPWASPTAVPPVYKSPEVPLPATEGVTVPSNDPDAKKASAVGKLLDILPYSGAYFSFDYDYSSNTFILLLKGSDYSLGNKEFDTFLQENKVENRAWIENLEIKYENITPAP